MGNKHRLLVFNILPAILWMAVIFVLCSIPASNVPHISIFEGLPIDKVVHGGMHFVLAFLLSGWFKNQGQFKGLQKNAFIYAVVFCSIYGGIMELLQKYIFTTRSAEWGDEAANIIGALFGILAYQVVSKKMRSAG